MMLLRKVLVPLILRNMTVQNLVSTFIEDPTTQLFKQLRNSSIYPQAESIFASSGIPKVSVASGMLTVDVIEDFI